MKPHCHNKSQITEMLQKYFMYVMSALFHDIINSLIYTLLNEPIPIVSCSVVLLTSLVIKFINNFATESLAIQMCHTTAAAATNKQS
jgi:hypothetical protein